MSGPAVAARPEDVATLDGIVAAFYDVICGPAGVPRQWERDATLWIPVALHTFTHPDGRPGFSSLDREAYIRRTDPIVLDGFFEREIHRITHRFGRLAHVLSTYEARREENGAVVMRGVNSIQLMNDGARWWILAAAWDRESPSNPLPKEYLP